MSSLCMPCRLDVGVIAVVVVVVVVYLLPLSLILPRLYD